MRMMGIYRGNYCTVCPTPFYSIRQALAARRTDWMKRKHLVVTDGIKAIIITIISRLWKSAHSRLLRRENKRRSNITGGTSSPYFLSLAPFLPHEERARSLFDAVFLGFSTFRREKTFVEVLIDQRPGRSTRLQTVAAGASTAARKPTCRMQRAQYFSN